jgi:hypothetical protein
MTPLQLKPILDNIYVSKACDVKQQRTQTSAHSHIWPTCTSHSHIGMGTTSHPPTDRATAIIECNQLVMVLLVTWVKHITTTVS